jgi:uroporphyrinogen decarboxylase
MLPTATSSTTASVWAPPADPDQARAIIARFNDRVDQACRAQPAARTWVQDALHRRGARRCPVRLRRLSLDIILRYGDALADLFAAYPDDVVFTASYDIFLGYQRPDAPERVDLVAALTGAAEWTDEWGTRWRHAAGGVGASTVAYPLTDWAQLDAFIAGMPDPLLPGRLDAVGPALSRFGGHLYFAGMTHLLLYERLHCLRGLENTLEDLYQAPAPTERLLDALTEYYLGIIQAWGALPHVDALFMSEDWGTQQALMISPAMWRRFFLPRYRRLFDAAHQAGLDVIFHSCGNVSAIVGELVDAGIDVLDPLQPEAMDLAALAREYGAHVAFSGGLSDQTLARQTPAEVTEAVRRTIDLMGSACRNAYLVGPSNVLTPEIPLANIEALFQACHVT